jgi:xanthine dehydrogenase large subunit
MSKLATIGKSITHDSAELHVSGSANYVDDIPEIEGTVHVAPGYAKNGARGKITKCDLKAVRNFPGVLTVFTADDIPATNDCSPTIGDDPIFAEGHIEFHGQVIFAVVATTRDIARRAGIEDFPD